MHKGRSTKSPRRTEEINLCPVSPNRRPRVTGDVVNMRHVARARASRAKENRRNCERKLTLR
jgi:hypothetical protein